MIVRSVAPVVGVISLRFLGLFIVLPVVSLYALSLEGASKSLVGLMIGAYALTQLLFQVPFGILSDKIGRKKTLIIGFVIFIIGSLICAFADNIYTLILGRFLQGSGAVGAVGVALVSDIAKEEQRGQAMAFMGACIALSFALSMSLGPVLNHYLGTANLFLLVALISLIAIMILVFISPNPPKIHHTNEQKNDFKLLMSDPNLLRMNITNFLQKAFMTLAFLLIPIVLVHDFEWSKAQLWKVYLPSTVCGILAMAPSAIFGEKYGKSKLMLSIGIAFFAIGFLLMGLSKNVSFFVAGVIVFFVGFNIHEPLMQSMTSKFSKVHQKGVTLGIFNAFGYAGTFLGGLCGGLLMEFQKLHVIAYGVLALCLAWLYLIKSLHDLALDKNIYLSSEKYHEDDLKILSSTKGVIEWYKRGQDFVVKYNCSLLSEELILSKLSK